MALTKKQTADYYRQWLRLPTRDLDDVYGRYSTAKAVAWRGCERRCAERNGYCLSVITYNTSVFTAGFVYNGEKGKMFYVMTPSHVGEICVEDAHNEIF